MIGFDFLIHIRIINQCVKEITLAKRDYYEVLGVSKDASKDEIKKLIVNYQKVPS